jgi:ABC-type tungstate transport system permease subunit
MMAANYRHIGGGENRLGRHYSRFSAFWPPAALADQSLALRKSQNAGSNRRSRVNDARAMNAYTISDRGAWLSFANEGDLTVLVESDPNSSIA